MSEKPRTFRPTPRVAALIAKVEKSGYKLSTLVNKAVECCGEQVMRDSLAEFSSAGASGSTDKEQELRKLQGNLLSQAESRAPAKQKARKPSAE